MAPAECLALMEIYVLGAERVKQVPPDGLLCLDCFNTVQHGAGPHDDPALGHKSVCFSCGTSILRSRIHRVPLNCPERHIILRRTPPHLVNRLERVCRACWMAASREAQREMNQDAHRRLEIPLQGGLIPVIPAPPVPAPPAPPVPAPPAPPVPAPHMPAPPAPPVPAPHMPAPNMPAPPMLAIPEELPVPAPPAPPMPAPRVPHARQAAITILLPNYKRALSSSRHCIFEGCINAERFLVPAAIKERLLLDFRFYIPLSARICNHHLNGFYWHELDSQLNSFTAFQIEHMMHILSNANQREFDFNNVADMAPHICHYWLGMTAEQFGQLLQQLPNLHAAVPSASVALSIFLLKMRTGDSNERLSSLFKMPRSTLERYMKQARDSLFQEFVPLYLGLNHMTVQEVAARNKIIPDGLFGNPNLPNNIKPAITISDGTYIYVQSSSNYSFQKKTYSLHKYTNLVKPFMIVCCDGHILDAIGPYQATENDSSIMRKEFLNPQGEMRTFFRAGDVFILDRGFRDVVAELERYGYSVHMPESLEEGEHQLTTLQANRSRCVTMCRWVVEVINGRIKRDFRIFRQDYFNRAATHLMVDFKIACALLNRFHSVIEDNPNAVEYLQIAQNKLYTVNNLSVFIQEENINRRRAMFNIIDGDNPHLNNFPRLTIEDLKRFALGSYQLKQARSYYGEHMRQHGSYIVEICQQLERYPQLQNNTLVRGRIRSRHVRGRTYCTYLLINSNINVANSLDAIEGYYCSCLVGNRTVGCCAHTMTVLWYLSWARFNDIIAPAVFLDNIFDANEHD